MRCKSCDYYLWNIDGRNCPECGTAFSPSEYEFKPNAVTYCCPHCQQTYYGTDEKGHLVPRTFACVQCNNTIDMDQMILLPAEGFGLDDTSKLPPHPWEDRTPDRSRIAAWFRTAKDAMVKPKTLVHQRRREDSISGHWGFLIWNYVFIWLITLVPLMLFFLASLQGTGNGNLVEVLSIWGFLLIMPFAMILYALIGIVILGSITHGLLLLMGKPQGTIGDTFRCMCYSQGVMWPAVIPICGWLFAAYVCSIWFLVSSILMLKHTHKTSGTATSIAVLALPVVWFAFVVLLS